MRRYFTILLAAAMIAAYTPMIEASQSDAAQRVNQNRSNGNRNNGGGANNNSHQKSSNQGNGDGQRPNNQGNGGGQRPNNQGNGGGQRPNNPGNGGSAQRPNNPGNGGSAQRPNNPGNGGSAQRPNNPGNGGSAQRPNNPGNNWNNGHGYGPHNPWNGHSNNVPHFAPQRPMMPYGWRYARPVPPPAFRPAPGAPNFGAILGLALGTTVNYALSQLFGNGYYVTGYTNDAVYLNDVMMFNYVWPHATLIYNRGYLSGSDFVYSTYNNSTSRYYNVYNNITANYGMPATNEYLPNGGIRATWWGFDGRYIQLSYQGGYANDGQYRYFTSLTIGN